MTKIVEEKIKLNEVTLSVSKKGDGLAIVCLHGFPEGKFIWEEYVDKLGEKYKMISYDMRGYGESSKLANDEDYTIEKLVAELYEMVTFYGLQKFIIMAHDWGGIVAWHFIQKYNELVLGMISINAPHPGVFKKLLDSDPDQQKMSFYIKYLIRDDAASICSKDNFAFFRHKMFDLIEAEDQTKYLKNWNIPGMIESSVKYYKGYFKDLKAYEFTRFTKPTLVLWGEEDHALSIENVYQLSEFVEEYETIKFPGNSHWLVSEKKKEIVPLVAKFVSKHFKKKN